jgi:two-component sensor histidine kinase
VLGSAIWLPAERATQCALVINELVQNAIEHGMARRDEGHVQVELVDRGDRVSIIVTDDGEGLPEGFGLDTSSNLGLRIVRSMVERDLRGEFELQSDRGKLTSWVGEGRPCTAAIVHFSKSLMGGN